MTGDDGRSTPSRSGRGVASVVAASLALIAACSKAPAPPAPEVAPPCSPTAATVDAASATGEPAAPDAANAAPAEVGHISLRFEPTRLPRVQALARDVRGNDALAALASEIDRTIILPKDLALVFADCGTDNAFYADENRTVTMCWELMGSMRDNMRREYKDPQDARDALYGAAFFTLIHELGHAFVDLLDLPITGKEEDAVDQLATFMLVDAGDAGVEMALDGALSFVHDAEAEAREAGDDGIEPAYWDEHATSEQRFFNIVCWIYGANPEAHGDLLESAGGSLPDDRADLCPAEWKRLSRAWTTLLAPHSR